MPVDTTSLLEGADIESKYREQILSIGITEEDAIAALAEFDAAIELLVDTMQREKAVLAEMIANGELKKKEPPKEPSLDDIDLDQCISTLENLKERTKFYPVILSEYSEDYIEDLMKVENAVFDKLISLLKCLE